jgi:hypothetical protein
MGQWRNIFTILDLCTRWRWVVSFTPRQIYYQGNSPRNPLYRWLGWPQNRSGRCGEEKILLPLPGITVKPSRMLLVKVRAPLWRVGCWNALPSPGVLGSLLSFSIFQAILNTLEVSNPLFWCAPSESFIEFLKNSRTKFAFLFHFPNHFPLMMGCYLGSSLLIN